MADSNVSNNNEGSHHGQVQKACYLWKATADDKSEKREIKSKDAASRFLFYGGFFLHLTVHLK